jgi:hypothetical protein
MYKVTFHYVFVCSIFEIQTYSSIFEFPQKHLLHFFWTMRRTESIDSLERLMFQDTLRGKKIVCVWNEYWEKSIDSYERLTFEDASQALLGEEIVHVLQWELNKSMKSMESLIFEDASRALLEKKIVCVCNENWERSIDSYERLTVEDASWALLGEEIVHVLQWEFNKSMNIGEIDIWGCILGVARERESVCVLQREELKLCKEIQAKAW